MRTIKQQLHNQFSLPLFGDMFKYAGFKCGYFEDESATYQKPGDCVSHVIEPNIMNVKKFIL